MDTKFAALTFDDGPSDITLQILDILKEHLVKASFFLIGNNITPETISISRKAYSEGHELCNHSLTHSDMTTLSPEQISNEIDTVSKMISDITGTNPKFFRPPFIYVNDTMFDSINLPFIYGIDSRDWDESTSPDTRIQNVLNEVKDGSIILMHDMAGNINTIKALPKLITELKNQGYKFVTISDLFAIKGVNPNVKSKLWTHIIE